LITRGDIEVARGAVREGVAAIQNLGQLLRSPRVGLRPLARALPEMREGCEALAAALSDFERAVAACFGEDDELSVATRQMLAPMVASIAMFSGSLEGREKRPLEARRRLAIETELRKLAPELEAVLWLADLVAAAAATRVVAAELVEVLRKRWATAPSALVASVRVEVAPEHGFAGDPRIAALLLELGASVLLCGQAARGLVLRSTRQGEAGLYVRLRPAADAALPPARPATADKAKKAPLPQEARRGATPLPPPPEAVIVPLRAGLSGALAVGRAVARRERIELDVDANQVALTFGPAAEPETA
jgi:hypothetical protein